MLIAPDDATAQQIRALAINELDLERSQGRTLVLAEPLQLISAAYIAHRDANEFAVMQLLLNCREENARLRNK